MTSTKKKFLVGMLTGAMVFVSGLGTYRAFAAEPSEDMTEIDQIKKHIVRPHRPEWTQEQIANFSKKIAEHYGVNESEVANALKDQEHNTPHDINAAAMFAKISGKSFASVLEMKCDWHQVGEKLGISSDQVKAFFEQEMAERIAERSSLDTKTVNDLLKDGYYPKDIVIAGKIAKASNKNVKNVLAKKKINNTWNDVAGEFGVDIKNIMSQQGRHGNFGGDDGYHRGDGYYRGDGGYHRGDDGYHRDDENHRGSGYHRGSGGGMGSGMMNRM